MQLRTQDQATCATLAPLFNSKLKEVDAALAAMQAKRAALASWQVLVHSKTHPVSVGLYETHLGVVDYGLLARHLVRTMQQ